MKENVKPFAWGFVAGAIVLLIVIFSAGWVVTSGSAQTKANQMMEKAVLSRLVPISMTLFNQDPNKVEKLAQMKKLDSWGENSRSKFVEKQGWATMPGEKKPDSLVADECSRQLFDLK